MISQLLEPFFLYLSFFRQYSRVFCLYVYFKAHFFFILSVSTWPCRSVGYDAYSECHICTDNNIHMYSNKKIYSVHNTYCVQNIMVYIIFQYSILITQFVYIFQVSIDYLARESPTNVYLPVAEFWVVRRDRPDGASSNRNYSRRSKSILRNSAACLTCFSFKIFLIWHNT